MMDRRSFLLKSGTAGLALAALGVGGCMPGSGGGIYRQASPDFSARHLPRVKISLDRIIKETVGLRPYRLSGPNLGVQQLNQKTIVHNYGHGGSGFSLSWGTGRIAATHAAATGEKQVAVMGCGVVGLTTARLLQEKGVQVTIYAKELWPRITSSMATGTWSPSHLLIEEELITPEFVAMWEQACLFSFQSYQHLLGFGDLVTWIDHYVIGAKGPSGEPPKLHVPGLLPDRVVLSRRQHPFRADQVVNQPGMMFNIPSYLQKLTDDFVRFGGKVVIRDFKNLDEVDALPEKCVVNCTGLGAKELFGDDQLMPISGQLSFLIPQPEIKYRLSTPQGYVIPRKDGLVLGGNAIRNNWNTTPDAHQTEVMVAAINEVVSGMRS